MQTTVKNQSDLMPVLFLGHGSPMNAIEQTEYSRNWKKLGEQILQTHRPKSILCISAHWVTSGTKITSNVEQKMIYDFYGFPKMLYGMKYPAKGNVALAKEITSFVKTTKISLDESWGLDHGSWSVLVHMFPRASIPVLQLSVNENLSYDEHFKIGQELNRLRSEGVLILGLGNIVHNLGQMRSGGRAQAWAVEFDKFIMDSMKKKDYASLIHFEKHKYARISVPTDEHYLPLLYVLGATEGEAPEFFNDKIEMGSVSMTSVSFGIPKK